MRDDQIVAKLKALPKCDSRKIHKRSGIYAIRWLKKDDGRLIVVVAKLNYGQFVVIEGSSETKKSINILLKWSVIK